MAARKSQTLQVPEVSLPPGVIPRIVRGGFPPAERVEYIDKSKKAAKPSAKRKGR
jgi:hypothetical protein